MHLGRAKSLMAGGFALLAFVAALAAGAAGAAALGGFSWLMVTAGAAGVVMARGVGPWTPPGPVTAGLSAARGTTASAANPRRGSCRRGRPR